MNALLVYPEFPDTFWSFKYALKIIRKRAAFPPLGLLTVAPLLPADWKKRLVDLNVQRLRDKHLEWADYVFVSAMTVQRDSAREIIDRCRRAGVRVVAGGPLFTCEHEDFDGVDHFVLNEAEATLPPFLDDLAHGCAKRIYATSEYVDLRTTPPPMWDLIDFNRYASMCIQYSRGCPFNCEFCSVTALFGHKPRVKTAEQILTELNALYERGWRGSIFFVDDNFIGNRRRLKAELLPALIAWRKDKPNVTFYTEASIDLADDEEMMRMMAKAGFDQVFIGIETPDEAALASCGKKQNTRRDLVADIKRIQHCGLQVQGGFIVGFDTDTPTIFQRQIELIQNSGIVTAMVGMLQAPPGTSLYERLKGQGRIRGTVTGDNVDGTTNILPAMGLAALRKGYKRILTHIYSPEQYYARVKTFLEEFAPVETARAPLDFKQLLIFFRSMLHLGILSRERFQYWRLILWTLFRRPQLLRVAVTLAILGHHFRKVSERHVA